MLINGLSIDNLASFIGFKTVDALKKNVLIYGTNGAGKSTIANLLRIFDDYCRKPSAESEQLLVQFLRVRKSKEASSERVTVEVTFDEGKETITFDSSKNKLNHSGNTWVPVKVFNEEYTNRTIGEHITVDLKTSILIGQINIELEKLTKSQEALEIERDSHLTKIDELVSSSEAEYRSVTESTGQTSHAINRDTLLAQNCPYSQNPEKLIQRKNIGFGKVQTPLEKLDTEQVKLRVNISDVEENCNAQSEAPTVSPIIEKYLKDYTLFFTYGVEIYQKGDDKNCPFCRRAWADASETIAMYQKYLQSSYNKKRKEIASYKNQLENYKTQINSQSAIVSNRLKIATAEAEKYQVDISAWNSLIYDQPKHDSACKLLDRKHESMDQMISIKDSLSALEKSHTDCINTNNEIISSIIGAVDNLTSSRKALNRDLIAHFAAKAWADCKEHRDAIRAIAKKLEEINPKISTLKEDSPPKDAIRGVFNRLTEFLSIGEYSLDESHRLQISLGKNYDISSEGVRISSAQRKLLSLCYFFAEIVSEISDLRALKRYILVFDDPVDSADYIFFYSIAAVIENAESILARILSNTRKVSFGQIIVMTHNSLLYERLACRWAHCKHRLRKENNLSIIGPADRSINNYNEYISEICRYYKNPAKQKRQMIHIGNLIRRVLEILASFDNLGNQNFDELLEGSGKLRLALLANHLSHESFTRILNPLSTPEELQIACGELLDVIRERHPHQYLAIIEKHDVNLTSSGAELLKRGIEEDAGLSDSINRA
jgi:wobble nucleotide-excising tRNase